MTRPASPVVLAASGALAVSLALAGCVAGGTPSGISPSPSPSTSASTTPVTKGPPKLVPNGTAEQNVAYFRLIGHRLLDHHQDLKGKAIIDGYVRAGFDKKNMELTPDKTSIGLDAWNIEWSVRFGDSCIIGQAGNTRFQHFVGPVLSTGTCLFGTTRPITW